LEIVAGTVKAKEGRTVRRTGPGKNMDEEEREYKFATQMMFAGLSKEFEESQNPIAALRAFSLAHHVGQAPPRWAIDFLSDGIDLYLQEKADTLDKALKLKKQGKKGKWTPPREKEALGRRDSDLVFFMIMLQEVFDLTLNEAIEKISTWQGVNVGDRTLKDLHSKKAATLRKKFKQVHQGMTNDEMKELWQNFTP
jgi:hypothetical protein